MSEPQSALPSVRARVIAFASILICGALGGAIGYWFADLSDESTLLSGFLMLGGTVVFSLGAAVVDGTHWESLAVDQRDGAVEIDALLDPVGSSALTKATGDLSTEDEPRNQLAIYAEGRVLAAPMVVQPIYGGTLVITGAYTVEEAQALVDRLTG